MRLIPENLGSKLIGAFAILLFVLSSPTKSFIWHLPSVDYIEIASGESKSYQTINLECASSSSQSFGGRILFQDLEGRNAGFIPFTIKPYGLLKKNIKNVDGSFRLEVDYKRKRSLNCYVTLEPDHILLPFDQEQNHQAYITLGAESQNRTAKKVLLSIGNLSKDKILKLNATFYGKDGDILNDLSLELAEIAPRGRLVTHLPTNLLSIAGLIKLQTTSKESQFSAYLYASDLDEEQYNSNFISSATNGTCKNKNFNINVDTYEQALLEITNVSESESRAYITVNSRSGHKILEDSVLIPKGTTFPFRIQENNGFVNISCDQGSLISTPSWQNDDSYTLSYRKSYTTISLPIVKRKGIKNIIRLNSESSNPSLIGIDLYSTKGEKLFSPFEEVELQGNLSIPLDQHLGPQFEAVAVLTSKRNSEELVRVSLVRKEDTESDVLLKFPDSLLTAKEEKSIDKLDQEIKKNIEIPENTFARREKDLISLINDKDFESHCINRTRTAVPDASLNNDSLEFELNLRKLLKHGLSEVKTFKINDFELLAKYLQKNNFLLPQTVSITNNNNLLNDLICTSLLYSNRNKEIYGYFSEIDSLSFDFRKLLVKGTIEKRLKLDGAAWLKAAPDNYLFCFRTAPDCELKKEIITQYSRSFLSPQNQISIKPSGIYPLLTIDRPFRPKSNKNFKIKAYVHEKVPYEIIANIKGIKNKTNNNDINCKDLNGKHRLIFNGTKWISARQNWDRTHKFDLNLSYNPITFTHSRTGSSGPVVADNCNANFKECNPGIWSLNIANSLSSGSEPSGWGRFTQTDKFKYRWNALPLFENKELEFNTLELSNSNDQPVCDYSKAKAILSINNTMLTVPELTAKREVGNTYILPRKVYSSETYPQNQPAPGIPYSVESNLNPYITSENRLLLSTSSDMVGLQWLDEIPKP